MYNTTHRSGGTSPYVHTILESYNVCIASSFDETYIHEDDFRELLCQAHEPQARSINRTCTESNVALILCDRVSISYICSAFRGV